MLGNPHMVNSGITTKKDKKASGESDIAPTPGVPTGGFEIVSAMTNASKRRSGGNQEESPSGFEASGSSL